jgi:hypothetical protein
MSSPPGFDPRTLHPVASIVIGSNWLTLLLSLLLLLQSVGFREKNVGLKRIVKIKRGERKRG